MTGRRHSYPSYTPLKRSHEESSVLREFLEGSGTNGPFGDETLRSSLRKHLISLQFEIDHTKKISEMYKSRARHLKEEKERLTGELQVEKIWHVKHRDMASKLREVEGCYIALSNRYAQLADLTEQLQDMIEKHDTPENQKRSSILDTAARIMNSPKAFDDILSKLKNDLDGELKSQED
jgi:hypothetical protein